MYREKTPLGKGLKKPLRKEANSEGLRVGLGLTIQNREVFVV